MPNLEIRYFTPEGEEYFVFTDSIGNYNFDTVFRRKNDADSANIVLDRIACFIQGLQPGYKDSYNYHTYWLVFGSYYDDSSHELANPGAFDVQMILRAEDEDYPDYDLLEHLKYSMGHPWLPGSKSIRYPDEAYPLKVFWNRAEAPSDRVVDLLKASWDLWEEAMNKHLPDDRKIDTLFVEVDAIPEIGLYCTWDYFMTAQIVPLTECLG